MQELIAGKYEVVEVIGRGGMGTVYKARHRELGRVVAIKCLADELAADEEFRARFQQEARIVAHLTHPNIVGVFDIEKHKQTFCIIMEYLEGESLQAKIDRHGTLPEREVAVVGAQVARALDYAHSQGIVHRDIKPDNIYITPEGVAKVMDFGIARFVDSKLKTQTGISMGTPKFMSPEQVTGKNIDGQTDLYSLGVCLYYCLAGRPPFDGQTAIAIATRHLYEHPSPPSHYNTQVGREMEKVVLKALEKDKSVRFGTGEEMADALEGLLDTRQQVFLGKSGVPHVSASEETKKVPSVRFGSVSKPESQTPAEEPAEAKPYVPDSRLAGDYSAVDVSDEYSAPRGWALWWPRLLVVAVVLLLVGAIWWSAMGR